MDWDVAFDRIGRAHLTASYPLASAGVLLEGTLRRYVPYFQLSTIWGYFSPVAYSEALLSASFEPLAETSARVSAGVRRYGDPSRSDFLARFRKATDEALARGFLLEVDAPEIRALAALTAW